MAERGAKRINSAAAGAAAMLVALLLVASPAGAQTAGLEQPDNWYLAPVEFGQLGQLPADHEISAPLCAAYNWAYGTVVMGLNVRARGTAEYYATLAINDNAVLETLDSVGPVRGAAQFSSGKYHVAAGLADGRLVVWLMAPGAYPQRLILSDYYTSGTPIDVDVFPPDPITAEWRDWWITIAYQYSEGEATLVVENFHGNGEFISALPGLPVANQLKSIDYYDVPSGELFTPFVVFTNQLDNQATPGNNQHLDLVSAYYNDSSGWVSNSLRAAGIYNGKPYIGWDGEEGYVLAAIDESDPANVYSAVQWYDASVSRYGQLLVTPRNQAWLPYFAKYNTFSYLETSRTSFPMCVITDGLYIDLGWKVPAADGSDALEYYFTQVFVGDSVLQGNLETAAYPIQGVAAVAHWSTGDPMLYWVQRGNSDGETGGLLYQLVYWIPRG